MTGDLNIQGISYWRELFIEWDIGIQILNFPLWYATTFKTICLSMLILLCSYKIWLLILALLSVSFTTKEKGCYGELQLIKVQPWIAINSSTIFSPTLGGKESNLNKLL